MTLDTLLVCVVAVPSILIILLAVAVALCVRRSRHLPDDVDSEFDSDLWHQEMKR